MRPLCQIKRPFEHGDRLRDVPLTQGAIADPPIRHNTAIEMRGRLRQLHPFRGRCRPLGKGATLGKAGGEMPTREDRDEPLHRDALQEVAVLETGHVHAEARDRLGIVPRLR